eukprot:m.168042 g.168042  ORF g.168042 m.168042 type:complete len:578 (-) comp31487_c0_seq1:137-1870(-)
MFVRAVVLVVGMVGLTVSDGVDNNTNPPSLSFGFSSNLPRRFSTDTTLEVGILGMKSVQAPNGSANVTAISIACSVDGKPLACDQTNQYEFRLRVTDLKLGQHTLEVTSDGTGVDKVHNHSVKLQHTWVVVSANPNVSIWNQPSNVLDGIADHDTPWEARIGLDTAASGLLCRLSNVSFDSWLQCCDTVFAIPECVSGCRSGQSPIGCEPLDLDFESCAANKSVLTLGTLQAEGNWLPCTSPVAMVSLLDGGKNNGKHGQNESTNGSALSESESLLPASQRYLFQVQAQGVDGSVGGNVASWEWVVLLPRLYNATTPYTNATELNTIRCATAAHVGLTSFAVLSWLLIAVVVLIAYRSRETLRAGWDPTKARMAKLEHSQRKLEIKMPKQIKFSAGKTPTSKSDAMIEISTVANRPIAPPRQKKSITTAPAKKLFTITMSDQANKLQTVSPEPRKDLPTTTKTTATIIASATIPLQSVSPKLSPTAPTRYNRGKLKSTKPVLVEAEVDDEPPAFAPPPTPSPSPSPPPSPPSSSPDVVFGIVKRKYPSYVYNTPAAFETDQRDAPIITPFQMVKFKR